MEKFKNVWIVFFYILIIPLAIVFLILCAPIIFLALLVDAFDDINNDNYYQHY